MKNDAETAKDKRLQQARRFLEAGRTQIDRTPAKSNRPLTADQADAEGKKANEQKPDKPDPTRFGDWEKNGRCIDF